MVSSDSGGIEIDVIADGHGFEAVLIERDVEDRLLLLLVEAAGGMGAERGDGLAGRSAQTRKGMVSSDSGGIEIDVIADGHGFEAVLIERDVEDRLLLLLVEAAGEIGAELLDEKRDAFGAAALMPDRILDNDL